MMTGPLKPKVIDAVGHDWHDPHIYIIYITYIYIPYSVSRLFIKFSSLTSQERLVTDKVISSDAFQWQSMLKSYWVLDENNEANAQMCPGTATCNRSLNAHCAPLFFLNAQLRTRLRCHQPRTLRQICDARMWYAYEYLGNGPRLARASMRVAELQIFVFPAVFG
jgi:hypothetical protein